MDPVPTHFRPADSEVYPLVEQHPLAWLVVEPLSAVLIPIRPLYDAGGELHALSGHLSRTSPLLDRLRSSPRALLLFSGPSAYISPSWMRNRRQAPTWASTSAAFLCEIRFDEDESSLEKSLQDLVQAMEHGRADAWRLDELGDRYFGLAKRIIAFRAEIVGARPAFRLCQDEDDETFADIVAGLRSDGNDRLADMMVEARDSPDR